MNEKESQIYKINAHIHTNINAISHRLNVLYLKPHSKKKL